MLMEQPMHSQLKNSSFEYEYGSRLLLLPFENFIPIVPAKKNSVRNILICDFPFSPSLWNHEDFGNVDLFSCSCFWAE